MIQEHDIDKEASIELYNRCSDVIERKLCYNNVFNVITYNGDKFSTGEWKIAYGYVKAIENLMSRHCFIVTSTGKAIDPTLAMSDYFDEYADTPYMSFRVLELEEYLNLLTENDNQPSLFNAFHKENVLANEWAKNNNVFLAG